MRKNVQRKWQYHRSEIGQILIVMHNSPLTNVQVLLSFLSCHWFSLTLLLFLSFNPSWAPSQQHCVHVSYRTVFFFFLNSHVSQGWVSDELIPWKWEINQHFPVLLYLKACLHISPSCWNRGSSLVWSIDWCWVVSLWLILGANLGLQLLLLL